MECLGTTGALADGCMRGRRRGAWLPPFFPPPAPAWDSLRLRYIPLLLNALLWGGGGHRRVKPSAAARVWVGHCLTPRTA